MHRRRRRDEIGPQGIGIAKKAAKLLLVGSLLLTAWLPHDVAAGINDDSDDPTDNSESEEGDVDSKKERCNASLTRADGTGETGSIEFEFGLGYSRGVSRLSPGHLKIHAETMPPTLGSPQSLKYVRQRSGVNINQNGTVSVPVSSGQTHIYKPLAGTKMYMPQGGSSASGMRLFEADSNFDMLPSGSTNAPAYYCLAYPYGRREYYSTNGIEHIETSAGQIFEFSGMGVDVVRTGEGIIRQVKAPQSLADIQTVTDSSYRIDYYDPMNVGTNDANGVYQVTGDPFATWLVEYCADGTTPTNHPEWGTDLMAVSKLDADGSEVKAYRTTYSSSAVRKLELMYDGSSQVARKQTEQNFYDSEDRINFNKVVETADANGVVAFREVKRKKEYGWGEAKTEREVGNSLVYSRDYYNDPNQPNQYSQLKHEVTPGSGWRKFLGYDAYSRKTNVVVSFKDADMATSAAADAASVNYTYSTNDIVDLRPRSEIRRIKGTIISKKWTDYSMQGNERVMVENSAALQNASENDASNLKTTTKHFVTDSSEDPRADRISSKAYPDGLLETYAYTNGTFSGTGESASFTPGSGDYWREAVVRGSTDSPTGIVARTTRETEIQNDEGRTVYTEREVLSDSGYQTIDWSQTQYAYPDSTGSSRIETNSYADGTSEILEYDNEEVVARTERDGTRYEFAYDGDRLYTIVKEGYAGTGSQPAVTNNYEYNGADKITEVTVSAGNLSETTAMSYDNAGRPIETVDPAGLTNKWSYSSDRLTTTHTMPGGATKVTTKYESGDIKSVAGTGVIDEYRDYGANADGTRWETAYTATNNGPRWVKTTRDMADRVVKVEKPAYGGATNVVEHSYATNGVGRAGHIVKTASSGNPDTLYQYDELGNLAGVCVDADGQGDWDYGGTDRIATNSTRYVQHSNEWVREAKSYVFAEDGSSAATLQSTRRDWMPVELGSSAPSPYTGILTAKSSTTDIHGQTTWKYTYTDAANKKVVRVVDHPDSDTDAVTTTVNGLVTDQTDKTGVTTTYSYDALGRRTGSETQSDGETRTTGTTINYNSKGQVAWSEDAATNRTSYAYDDASGRRVAVTNALGDATHTQYDLLGNVTNTWGATYPVAYEYDQYGQMTQMKTWRDESGSPDVTEWLYEASTGLLTNKAYADDNGTAYEYYADGQIKQRTWARGETTDYSYDSLNQLTNVAYSATSATPDIAYSYDRRGRKTEVTQSGTGFQTVIHRFGYDDSTLALTNETVVANGETNTIARSYDSYGRTSGIDLGGAAASLPVDYGFDSTGRFGTLVATNGNVEVVNVDYNYISGSDLISGTTNSVPGLGVSRSYETNRDLLTQVHNQAGGTTISKFEYQNDELGRRTERLDTYSGVVTNSFGYNARSEVTNAVMGANSYAWNYDPIGNRESYTENGTTLDYLVNQLNQYTNIANGVTLTPEYDSDGNMTNYNGWAYQWNGENRLRIASDGSTSVTNKYDYMGRRISKSVDGVETEFLYDGWNLVQEITGTNVIQYVWGLDLSQSLQGAGGVGGLLCVIENGEEYYPCFDANGNITEYVDSTGTVVAHYEYSAFGKITSQSGTKADDFAFRFSTKYFDAETGLYAYGYRYFQPDLGRWINRDPLLTNSAGNYFNHMRKTFPYLFYSDVLKTIKEYKNRTDKIIRLISLVEGIDIENISNYSRRLENLIVQIELNLLKFSNKESGSNSYPFPLNDPINDVDPDGESITAAIIAATIYALGTIYALDALNKAGEALDESNEQLKKRVCVGGSGTTEGHEEAIERIQKRNKELEPGQNEAIEKAKDAGETSTGALSPIPTEIPFTNSD